MSTIFINPVTSMPIVPPIIQQSPSYRLNLPVGQKKGNKIHFHTHFKHFLVKISGLPDFKFLRLTSLRSCI